MLTGKMRGLRLGLDLSQNELTGTIPESFGKCHMKLFSMKVIAYNSAFIVLF